MNKIYDIKNFHVTPEYISFELSENKIDIPLTRTGSTILPQTKLSYLQIFEIDEDGIGIHWPVIDEDLSIEGLLCSAGRKDLIVKHIPSMYIEEEESKKLLNQSKEKKIIHAV